VILWLLLTRSWQRRTFGESRDVRGPLKHLHRELAEIAISPTTSTVTEECADVVFLAWQIAHRTGASPIGFVLALWRKLFVNWRRKWPEPVDGEPCEHRR